MLNVLDADGFFFYPNAGLSLLIWKYYPIMR